MKKISIFLFMIIFVQGLLYAMTTSLGVISNLQLTSGPIYYQDGNTSKMKVMNISSLDLRIAGSTYFENSLGLGYEIGLQKDLYADDTFHRYDLSDLLPSLELVLQIKYNQPINQFLGYEVGCGLIANIFNGSGEVGSKNITTDYKEFSIMAKISMIARLCENFDFLMGLESMFFTYHLANPETMVASLPKPSKNRVSISPSIGLIYVFH